MPAKQDRLTNLRLRVISLEKQMARKDKQIDLLTAALASLKVVLQALTQGN